MFSKRASKTTYLTDIPGNTVIQFQFSPHEISGAESGNFSERVRVGGHEPELIWISGTVRKMSIPFFIDRTEESVSQQRFNNRPLDPYIRFPNRFPRSSQDDALAYRQGVANGNGAKETPELERSNFDPNPNFRLFQNDTEIGVYRDLDLFLKFVRPAGKGLTVAKFEQTGEFRILDTAEARFFPPPVVRFFHGNYWLQGYLARIEYRMSAMNGSLVPRRLEGTLDFLIEKDGVLAPV